MSEPTEYDVVDDPFDPRPPIGMAKDWLEKRLPGIDVVFSRDIPVDRVYLMPKDTFLMGSPQHPARIYETLEPRWEAVAIVQEGMADIVAWLRAAGHDMPDAWVQQADHQREEAKRRRGIWYDGAMPVGPIINPRSFITIVTGT